MTEAEGEEWDAFVINIGREITEEECCEVFGIVVEWVPKGMEEDERVAMKYKKVANKTRPVATTLPEEYCIVRRQPAEPLKELPVLPINPGVFTLGERYCKGLILFHILISSHFLLLASIFEFQCFGLFSGLTCPKFMGLEPLCYSYFCAFLGLLSVT